jgi:hypothetical protein
MLGLIRMNFDQILKRWWLLYNRWVYRAGFSQSLRYYGAQIGASHNEFGGTGCNRQLSSHFASLVRSGRETDDYGTCGWILLGILMHIYPQA